MPHDAVRVKPCGLVWTSHLPGGVGGITVAELVTDEAVEARWTEPFLTIGTFKACFTQTSSIDVVTLGTILALALLVTLCAVGAHWTVLLTSGGRLKSIDVV